MLIADDLFFLCDIAGVKAESCTGTTPVNAVMIVYVLDAFLFDFVSSTLLLPIDTKCPDCHVCSTLRFNNASLSFKELDWHRKAEIQWANHRDITEGKVVFYIEGSTEDVGVTLLTT